MAYNTTFINRGKFDGNEKLYKIIEEAGGPMEAFSKYPIPTLVNYIDSDNSKLKSSSGLEDVLEDLEVGSKLGYKYFNRDKHGPDCASEAVITENTKFLEVKKMSTAVTKAVITFGSNFDLEKANCFKDTRVSVAAGIFDGFSLKCIVYGPGIRIADKLTQHYNKRASGELSKNTPNAIISLKALLEECNFRVKLINSTKEDITNIFKNFWKTFDVTPYID